MNTNARTVVLSVSASAVIAASPAAQRFAVQQAGDPRSRTASALMTPITLEIDDVRVEDLVSFIRDTTGAELEPIWADEFGVGMDRERRISINVRDRAAFSVLEQVIDRVEEPFDENNWQFTDFGALRFGPESRLARDSFVVVYPVDELLFVFRDFDNFAGIDQQGGGAGGGGGGLFDDEDEDDEDDGFRDELIEDLIEIIQINVQPEHWQELTGGHARIREFRRSLIVNAAPFVHREIGGEAVFYLPGTPANVRRWAEGYTRTRPIQITVLDVTDSGEDRPAVAAAGDQPDDSTAGDQTDE